MISEICLSDLIKKAGRTYPGPLTPLDREIVECAQILSAFLLRTKKLGGPHQHRVLAEFLGSGIGAESDLREWIESRSDSPVSQRVWDSCRKRAESWLAEGITVTAWKPSAIAGSDVTPCRSPCPAVLFAKGKFDPHLPRIAIFNSRKPRPVSPDSPWLKALRTVPGDIASSGVGLATGLGTLTYDMTGTFAVRSALPLTVAAPCSVLKPNSEFSRLYGKAEGGIALLSCLLDTSACTKTKRLLCRDRILAELADIHIVLEIRSGGNLATVLREQQRRSPRLHVVYEPEKRNSTNSANFDLLREFPAHARAVRIRKSEGPPELLGIPCPEPAISTLEPDRIDWNSYLFHYTRACPGPWPGQTYSQYLLSLLDGDPLSGHSAFDTLTRILEEGLIRAGSGMVRGSEAVISWSSHPPSDLFRLRKWNPALVRWTVEPYGLAFRRDFLRSVGAKPAVYGREEVYSSLPATEKHRFQLSRSRVSDWRHEREWRLRGDLNIMNAGEENFFVFVQTERERRFLELHETRIPVIALESSGLENSARGTRGDESGCKKAKNSLS